MQKYYKIGEVSRLYKIGVDSLRYYEDLGILSPRRADNGYRMYSIKDMWRLNVIRDLRELGFGMEQIRSYLENRSVDSTIALLDDERKVIRQKMQALQSLHNNVTQRLNTIREARDREVGVVRAVTCGTRRCYLIPEGYRTDEEMDLLIKRLLNIDPDKLYVVGNNQIGSKINLESARSGAVRSYDAVFIVDANGDHLLEQGEYLTVSFRGASWQNATYIPMLLQAAERSGLRPVGHILELLWVDIHASADLDEHITELQVLVVKDRAGAAKGQRTACGADDGPKHRFEEDGTVNG